MKRPKRVPAAAVLVLLLTLSIPAALSAQITISNEMIHRENAASGQTYYGVIRIRNVGTRNELVRLSQNDYLFYADGTNIYGEPGTDLRSNARWVQLVREELTVAPGKEEEVRFTVRVPGDPSLAGTYWSLVMVQAITDSLLNPAVAEEGFVGVTAGIRYGIQIVTSIGTTGEAALTFNRPMVQQQAGAYALQIDLENVGERWLSLNPHVDLYSENGRYIGRFALPRRGLYPGTSARLQFPFPEVPAGSYRVQVIADGGENDLFGVVYAVQFK